MYEHDALISEYSHEKHRPREGEALHMLKKVASIVKPIMRQRTWRVGTLGEFYPDERNLLGLNINGGQKILLRLRQPYDDKQFLALEQVVDTMLHELCHIVYGPHNQDFHTLWNQLRDEHEALLRKGYTGEGFLSTGRKLGGYGVPQEELRRRARAAITEQRKSQQGNIGHRLGGHAPSRYQDIRAVIANAAQRRIDIMKGCASDTQDSGWKEKVAQQASNNGFRTKAEEDDANERAIMQAYIDLIQEEEQEKYGQSYVPPSQNNPIGRRRPNNVVPTSSVMPPPVPFSSKPSGNSGPLTDEQNSNIASSTANLGQNSSYNDDWSCTVCTLNNPSTYLCCDACGTERPAPVKTNASSSRPLQPSSSTPKSLLRPTANGSLQRKVSYENLERFKKAAQEAEQSKPLGWNCHLCGNFMESQWWICANCGTMKLSS